MNIIEQWLSDKYEGDFEKVFNQVEMTVDECMEIENWVERRKVIESRSKIICSLLVGLLTEYEWISVETGMPDFEKVVICYVAIDGELGFRTLGFIGSDGWYSGINKIKGKVTHWHPMPQNPVIKNLS